jgi:hypothetical protein
MESHASQVLTPLQQQAPLHAPGLPWAFLNEQIVLVARLINVIPGARDWAGQHGSTARGSSGTPFSNVSVGRRHGIPLRDVVTASVAVALVRSQASVDAHAREWGSKACREGPSAAAGNAEAIITCLPNSDHVVATKARIASSLRPGTIWIDTTSGSAERAAELARELHSDYAVHYLDCAVSGGPAGARIWQS